MKLSHLKNQELISCCLIRASALELRTRRRNPWARDFAGSARFSQCCSPTGVKLGFSVDIRDGFNVMISKGRRMVLSIIKEQAHRRAAHGQTYRTPNMKSRRSGRSESATSPIVEFVASIARCQLRRGRYFIIEKPQQAARIGKLRCAQQVLFFEILGDPESGLRGLNPTSLMHCRSCEA